MKLGRKPPVNKPALLLADVISAVPSHPPAEDYLNIGGWQMLGNDQYGDCVAVTWANVRRLMTRQAGAEHYPSFNQVIEFYKTQNPSFPSEDNGMVIQLALEELNKNGGPDGVKALAFAKVDITNLDEVKAALAIFGYLWTGLTVLQSNFTQFDSGDVWRYSSKSQVAGGHSVISGGYDSDRIAGDVRFVTWGKETSCTNPYWRNEVEEAWVVIWPEHFGYKPFLEGIDQAKLRADYQALTGRTLQ